MEKLIRISFALLISFLISGCADTGLDDTDNMTITYGTVCGWCAGEEFITLVPGRIDYRREIPCGENKGTTTKTKALSTAEWEALAGLFDYSHFASLDHNTCNVCVDGCDEIMRIENKGPAHEIRYSPSDKIEGMEPLRQKLRDYLEEMREAG